jgi:serine/threonine protein kinase
MVFELADCNLHEFMEKHPAGMTHREITSAWLFKQMRGIAAALKEFHHIEQVIDDNTLRANDALPKPRTGYLHDIKPENILVFYANQNCLRLCDWSCAKVADFIASVSGQKLQSAQTVNHGTLTYKPPESHGRGKTSRPYDLWSLGCVLLELLIWYRLGWKELEIFREERLGKEDLRVTGIKDDKYYYVDKEGRMHVRISVLQRIDQLKDLLDGELKEVLDVIPDLLQVDSQKRLDTISLLDRLERVKTSTQVVSVSPRLASDGDANMLVSGPQIKVETYEG